MILGPVGDTGAVLVEPPNLERLCVTARAVMAGLPDLMDEGLVGRALQQTTAHAAVLSDFATLRGLSPVEVTDRGFGLCDALIRLGTEAALTHVAWVEDALGEF